MTDITETETTYNLLPIFLKYFLIGLVFIGAFCYGVVMIYRMTGVWLL